MAAMLSKRWILPLTLGLGIGLAGAPRIARGASDAEHLDPLAVVIEQMAEHIVFHDVVDANETAYLAANGYTAGPKVQGKNALVFRVFTPTRSGLPSVVALRGTVFTQIKTVVSDLDPSGIGADKFNANRVLIEETLKKAASRGPVISAGHSLGAALAQIAACDYPTLVSRVVTFHAPGIERTEAEKLQRYNQAHAQHTVRSDHYQCKGDIVSEAGEALTEGTIHEYKIDDTNFEVRHMSYLLADGEQARGHVPPPVYDKGRLVVYAGDRASSTKTITTLEKLREALGIVTNVPKKTSTAIDKAEDDVSKIVK